MPAHDAGDQLGRALNSYRMIRLGLEAMWNAVDGLPDGAYVDPAVRPALVAIASWLDQAEQGELRDTLMTRNYTIIRPVSLVSPPPATDLANITAAIGTLNGHALIIASE
jgi:hypothetical protein